MLKIIITTIFLTRSKKTLHLLLETVHTIKEEWARVVVLLFVALIFGAAYLDSNKPVEHYFDVFLEFIGALVLFLIVEHTIKKLGSGISDPAELPIKRFIADLEKSKNELIILDTVLESIMKRNDYRINFGNSLKTAITINSSFSVRILVLDLKSPYAKERADQLGMGIEEFLKIANPARMKLLHLKDELENDDERCRQRISIREYNISPPFAMYAIDRNAYISFFPKGKKSSDSRQLYIPHESELGQQIFDFFYSKFEEIWQKNSKEIIHL